MSEMADHLDRARDHLQAETPQLSYLTVREVAGLARCEHKAVRRAIAAGRLTAFQPVTGGRGKLLVREQDARAWIEGRPVRPTREDERPSRRPRSRPRPGSVASLRDLDRGVSSA